jgi:hypothetical protein
MVQTLYKLCHNLEYKVTTFFFFCSTVLDGLTYRRFLELFRHMVGLLGRVISPSQGLYLHRTTQHRNMRTNIHAFSGIRTHDPSDQPAKTRASDRTATVTGKVTTYRLLFCFSLCVHQYVRNQFYYRLTVAVSSQQSVNIQNNVTSLLHIVLGVMFEKSSTNTINILA